MEKLAYGLWRRPDQDLDALRAVLLEEVGPALLDLDPALDGVRILVEEPEGRVLRVGAQPDGGLLAATVSVWIGSYDDRGPVEALLERAGCTVHGWLVSESIARGYGQHRTWPDGERSPGISIMTVFDKRADVDDEAFYGIWHGEHTPLSFDIHPLWLYVRNQVIRPVTPDAPQIRGFVYEAVPTDEDMLDLTRFFGCPGEPDRLMDQVALVNGHMDTFADTAGLQCTPMREWILRTVST